MALAALIVAVVGLVSGAASLAWQLASFFLSGPRVRVELQQGLRGPLGVMIAPLGVYTVDGRRALSARGYVEHVLAIGVVNSGRLPTTVRDWSIVFGNGAAFSNPGDPRNFSLPHRLESHDQQTWVVPVDELLRIGAAFADRSDDALTVEAIVSLGSGVRVRSRERLILDDPIRAARVRRRLPAIRRPGWITWAWLRARRN